MSDKVKYLEKKRDECKTNDCYEKISKEIKQIKKEMGKRTLKRVLGGAAVGAATGGLLSRPPK